MKYKNVILGSGIVALICKKILGDQWKIIPIGPSRFYSDGIPAMADDFIIKHAAVDEIIKDWGLSTAPLFYKRPLSFGGQLLYESSPFMSQYFDKIGLSDNGLTRDYYKSNFTVYSFSGLQLWDKLLKEFRDEIVKFHDEYKFDDIGSIVDNTITLQTKTGIKQIEFDKMVSTIPANMLLKYCGLSSNLNFKTSYHYYVEDNNINLESANQVLIADPEIIFHKCTKINNNRYLFEVLDTYKENIYEDFNSILGNNFNIIKSKCVNNSFCPMPFNHNLDNITLVGSLAQPDPLMDIGSCIRRVYNLINNAKV